MKNYLSYIISFLLGGIFIFSAYIKLDPIELFEYTFVEIKVASWLTAPYIARIFIGVEFFIGLMLIFNLNGGKKWLAKFTLLFLIVLTIYLGLILLIDGNTGNCGCFGTFIKFTPLESIIKNLVLMSLVAVLLILPSKLDPVKYKSILFIAAIACLIAPFSNPISKGSTPLPNELNYSLDLASLYSSEHPDKPGIDLMKGKHIIAFLSLTCEHCRLAAYKLHLMHLKNSDIPIFFVLNGEQKNKKNFFEETKAMDIPHSNMTVKEGFVKNAGVKFPAILWVENGVVKNKVDYPVLKQSEIENWLSEN